MCSPCFICPYGSPSCCYIPCPSTSELKCVPATPAPQCPSPCAPSCPPPCFPSCPSLCPPSPCPTPSCPPPSDPAPACPPRACPSCPKCCPPPPKPEISFVSYPVCPSPSCPPPRLNPCPSRTVCFSSCNPPSGCCPSKCPSEIKLKPCKSYEFIGGTFIYGCDCGKHNGLQDSCRRTECRGTALCRARQWACCRPSKFSGGKHLASKMKEREC